MRVRETVDEPCNLVDSGENETLRRNDLRFEEIYVL